MKKSYKVEFTDSSGVSHVFETVTDDLPKFILEYSRNRDVASYKVLEEDTLASRQLLLG